MIQLEYIISKICKIRPQTSNEGNRSPAEPGSRERAFALGAGGLTANAGGWGGRARENDNRRVHRLKIKKELKLQRRLSGPGRSSVARLCRARILSRVRFQRGRVMQSGGNVRQQASRRRAQRPWAAGTAASGVPSRPPAPPAGGGRWPDGGTPAGRVKAVDAKRRRRSCV